MGILVKLNPRKKVTHPTRVVKRKSPNPDLTQVEDWNAPFEEDSPEKSLIAAVLYRSILDLFEEPNIRRAAIWWFKYSKPHPYSFCFSECCEALGIEEGVIVSKVKELSDWIDDHGSLGVGPQMKAKCPIIKFPGMKFPGTGI